MLIIFKKITFLIKCFLIYFILANISVSFADQLNIKKIVVNGEKRMSESFILNFLPNYPDTEFDSDVLNNFTKDLYNSGMFSNITLKINDTTLEVNVKEYPVINEISFTIAASSFEAAGKPTSILSTFNFISCSVILILSWRLYATPGVCSPSLKEVS